MNFNHFFEINVSKDAEPRLLTKGFYSFNNADYTPNGKQIIVSGDVDTEENQDRSLEGEIFIMDTNGENFKMLLGENGKRYNGATISPSGKWLAFLSGNTSFISVPSVSIMPLNGTEKDIVTIPFDRNKTNFIWSKDDK
jgi:Tol biopolymer transport system component